METLKKEQFFNFSVKNSMQQDENRTNLQVKGYTQLKKSGDNGLESSIENMVDIFNFSELLIGKKMFGKNVVQKFQPHFTFYGFYGFNAAISSTSSRIR